MSSAPASNTIPSRKSFAQVAAAANKPAISIAKNQSPPESNKNNVSSSLDKPVAPSIAKNDVSQRQGGLSPLPEKNGNITQISEMMQSSTLNAPLLSGPDFVSVAKKDNSDTKSVTSRTTLALDEKESLRPDDSASMKAAAEEDVSSPSDSVAVATKPPSDPDTRAFQDQLQEINRTETSRLQLQRRPPDVSNSFQGQGTGGMVYPVQQRNQPHQAPTAPNGNQPVGPPEGFYLPPDEKLLEALASPKDRLFVLKIEQDMIDFIKDSKEQELQLPQTNSFYRMLSHKLAEYYFLGHAVDETLQSVRICRLPASRLPPPLIGSQSKSEGTTPPPGAPTRKIMTRRPGNHVPVVQTSNRTVSQGDGSERNETSANATSNNSEDEKDPSTPAKDKSKLTREERESRYNEARARIFKDFNEKSQESAEGSSGQDKDPSRSSSAAGQKKGKRNRRPKDDSFDARSSYSQFGTQSYMPNIPANHTANDMMAPGMMQYPGTNQTFQYGPQGIQMVSPSFSHSGFSSPVPFQHPQYAQGDGVSPGLMNAGQLYPGGFDPNSGYQFSPANMAAQATPKPNGAQLAGYYQGYQPQTDGLMWPQGGYENQYGVQGNYNGDGTTMGMQVPFDQSGYSNYYPIANGYPQPGQNAYGMQQFGDFGGGQQFNPLSQSFTPGIPSGPGNNFGPPGNWPTPPPGVQQHNPYNAPAQFQQQQLSPRKPNQPRGPQQQANQTPSRSPAQLANNHNNTSKWPASPLNLQVSQHEESSQEPGNAGVGNI